jgi:glycerol-3-phosphate dehydrogenase (NAD(P)+)
MPQAGPTSHPRSSDAALLRYHERTRSRGVQPLVYWIARAALQPAIQLYFRLSRTGREHVPDGPVILAANHRSFLDPFVVGLCLRRPVYFVAKRELFENRLTAWFLNCLGAFPIRRGESDEEAVATSLRLLERGEAVVIFPEGTRIRNGSLGNPRRGVGRLALESGAPVVPVAVAGSDRARRGVRIRPVKVKVRCGRPLTFPRADRPSPRLASEVTARVWPCVELQWEWLGGLPLRDTLAAGGLAVGQTDGADTARRAA